MSHALSQSTMPHGHRDQWQHPPAPLELIANIGRWVQPCRITPAHTAAAMGRTPHAWRTVRRPTNSSAAMRRRGLSPGLSMDSHSSARNNVLRRYGGALDAVAALRRRQDLPRQQAQHRERLLCTVCGWQLRALAESMPTRSGPSEATLRRQVAVWQKPLSPGWPA